MAEILALWWLWLAIAALSGLVIVVLFWIALACWYETPAWIGHTVIVLLVTGGCSCCLLLLIVLRLFLVWLL